MNTFLFPVLRRRLPPSGGRALRVLPLLCVLLFAAFALPRADAAPAFEQRYEKAKQDMERLKGDSKRGGWREPWENLARDFLDIYETYPKWRNRPAALYRSAVALEELAARSMLRQDAQNAVARYERFIKDYGTHVLADDALFGIARLKAERLRDFAGAREALKRLQAQYPRGDVIPEAKVYAERLASALEAAKHGATGQKAATLTDMRWENRKGLAVVTLEFDRPIVWSLRSQAANKKNGTPTRIILDLEGAAPASTIRPGIKVQGNSLRRMRLDLASPNKTRLLLDFRTLKRFTVQTASSPFRLVLTTSATDAALPRGITVGKNLQSTDPLFRFSARTVVLDPGHGGKDPGTIHNGLVERDVTLDMAKRVGALLAKRGINVLHTRTDNTWVSLSTRSYIANQARADVLVSIHLNASLNENASGLETYFPARSGSSDTAKLAGLENANGDHKGTAPASLQPTRAQESRRLADIIQKCTLSLMKEKAFAVHDGGVKPGPFKVLLSSAMPGVLVELGYCSNPQEAQKLRSPAYRAALAEGLASGILAYLGSLDTAGAKKR